MSKVKRALLSLLIAGFIAFLATGCDPYMDQQPETDPNVVWIAEDSAMFFVWNEEKGFQGELTTGENTFTVGVDFRIDIMKVFYHDSKDEEWVETELFRGKCKYGKEQLVVSVTRDDANLFNSELPTITFIRQEKQADGTGE